jgi:hypothetical protein
MGDQESQQCVDGGDDPHVPDELIERVCRTLAPVNGSVVADLSKQLRAVAVQYLIDLSLEPYWGAPKEQRAALRKLGTALHNALLAMLPVAPEYAVALDSLVDRKDAFGPSLFDEAQQKIIDLRNAVDRFDAEYRPKKGRRTDLSLEEAVRRLIEVIEPLTGRYPKVQLNKHKGESPTLKSPEARAIGELLQGIRPSLKERAIANMIEKVLRQPRASESHVEALFRLDPNFELDASLLRVPRGD